MDINSAADFLAKLQQNEGDNISEKDLVKVLGLADFSLLYEAADAQRKASFGDDVDIRGILEFSNYCRQSCRYCGLNKQQRIHRYRMEQEEMVAVAVKAEKVGYKTLVMQSGEDPYYTVDNLCQIIEEIKSKTKLYITMSCGERDHEDYVRMKASGADRYLLKHETADPALYSALHPCGSLKKRVACLEAIQRAGLETGSGFMIGLPSQTLQTLAKDMLLLRNLSVDMAGIGPFIPCPGTDLEKCQQGSIELTKRCVALTRLLLPHANLPATTSLGVIDSKAKDSIFSCGANVIMRKVTPQKYEEHYTIYPNQIKVDNLKKDKKDLDDLLRKLGRIPR